MNKMFQEGVLVTLYVWNMAPVHGSDILRSLIVVSRDFFLNIVILAQQHLELPYTV